MIKAFYVTKLAVVPSVRLNLVTHLPLLGILPADVNYTAEDDLVEIKNLLLEYY